MVNWLGGLVGLVVWRGVKEKVSRKRAKTATTSFVTLNPQPCHCNRREDRRRGVFVDGLSEWVVRSPREVYELMMRGAEQVRWLRLPHLRPGQQGATCRYQTQACK